MKKTELRIYWFSFFIYVQIVTKITVLMKK